MKMDHQTSTSIVCTSISFQHEAREVLIAIHFQKFGTRKLSLVISSAFANITDCQSTYRSSEYKGISFSATFVVLTLICIKCSEHIHVNEDVDKPIDLHNDV